MNNKCCGEKPIIAYSCLGSPIVQGAMLIQCSDVLLKSKNGASVLQGDSVLIPSEPILKACSGVDVFAGDTVLTCDDNNYLDSVLTPQGSTTVTFVMKDGTRFPVDMTVIIDNYFKAIQPCA